MDGNFGMPWLEFTLGGVLGSMSSFVQYKGCWNTHLGFGSVHSLEPINCLEYRSGGAELKNRKWQKILVQPGSNLDRCD